MTYPGSIGMYRIRYVSDMDTATKLKYPCIIALYARSKIDLSLTPFGTMAGALLYVNVVSFTNDYLDFHAI